MVKTLYACLGIVILAAGVSHGSDQHESEDCRYGLEARAPTQTTGPSGTTIPELGAGAPFKAHSVRLSWDASAPASKSPADAIKGYDIYRREPGKQYEKINREPIPATRCTDHSVKAGQTYQYQTTAVSVRHLVSKPSNVAKAKVPSP